MKENVRIKQNKISQNIRKKKTTVHSPLNSKVSIWVPYGTLWAPYEVSLGPYDHLWTTYRPPRAAFGPNCAPICSLNGSLGAQYAPKWALMDPYGPIMAPYGSLWTHLGPVLCKSESNGM